MPTDEEETPEQLAAWRQGVNDYSPFLGQLSYKNPFESGTPEHGSYWTGWMDARDAADDGLRKLMRRM